MYTSRGCAEPRLDDIFNYKPTKSWDQVFSSVINHDREDGHAAKLVRTLAYGERLCKPFEQKEAFPIKGDMWLKLGNMGEYLKGVPLGPDIAQTNRTMRANLW